jgi:hypothetical protein
MRTSFNHQPEAQHQNLRLSTSRPADYPIYPVAMGAKQKTFARYEYFAF